MTAVQQGQGTSTIRIGDVTGWIKTGPDDPLHIVEFQLAPGAAGYPAHVHEKIFEGTYVIDGVVEARIGTEVNVFDAGTFLAVPPGTAHRVVAHEAAARILAIHCPGPEAFKLFDTLGNAFDSRPDPATLAAFIKDLDIQFVT